MGPWTGWSASRTARAWPLWARLGGAEAGFPDLTFQPTLVFLGLRSMPVALRERIAADIRAVAADPGLAEKMGPLGMVPLAGTPDELARVIEENRVHWAERAHTYGVRPIN